MSSDFSPLAHSVPDAAKRLGISRSGLYKIIADKGIPIAKVGGRTLILDDHLRAFLARRVVVSDQPSAS